LGFPAVSETFGKYQLERKLAVGGMAEIFLASCMGPEGFKKTLAIKRILPHLTEDQDFVTMFLDEARLVARFTHPNIVQIYELGRVEGNYFLAMEYVHGISTSRALKECSKKKINLPIEMGIKIISLACEGLDYAHSFTDADGTPLNLIHRDVNPQNIMVSYDGVVKVLDFGIAKASRNIYQTRASTLKGKAAYMSPEQIVQKMGLDRRSDIFSLGIVLYEFTTGRRPFHGDTELEIMMSILKGVPPDPQKLNPDIPKELVLIISRALEKDRERRHQSARELRADLEQYLINRHSFVDSFGLGSFLRELVPPTDIGVGYAQHNTPSPTPSPEAAENSRVLAQIANDTYRPSTPAFLETPGTDDPTQMAASGAFPYPDDDTEEDTVEKKIPKAPPKAADESTSPNSQPSASAMRPDMTPPIPPRARLELEPVLVLEKKTSGRTLRNSAFLSLGVAAILVLVVVLVKATGREESAKTDAGTSNATIAVVQNPPTPKPLPLDPVPSLPDAGTLENKPSEAGKDGGTENNVAVADKDELVGLNIAPDKNSKGAKNPAKDKRDRGKKGQKGKKQEEPPPIKKEPEKTVAIVRTSPDPVAPTRPPEPVAVADTKGTILIDSQPWTEVSIDGTSYGSTPLDGPVDLPAGPHSIEMTNKAAGIFHKQQVQILGGRSQSIRKTFEKGFLQVFVKPFGEVFINGASKGITPLDSPIEVYEGTQTLRVFCSRTGKEETRKIKVFPGKTIEVRIDLM
jgi:eukaryotic-like serine/threonine-protein kinase